MSSLKRLWTKIRHVPEALDGADDPTDDYLFSLGERVDKLEGHVRQLENELHSRPDGE